MNERPERTEKQMNSKDNRSLADRLADQAKPKDPVVDWLTKRK